MLSSRRSLATATSTAVVCLCSGRQAATDTLSEFKATRARLASVQPPSADLALDSLPPVKVKLDLYNPERHLHLSTMIAQPVEYPQGTVLVQAAASLLSDALTMLHDTEGDASPVEKAQAALVILLVCTLSKTHGPASMNLDLADWVKFVDTIEEEHYRQLKSYADEVHRGNETPQHVATFLLKHIEAEGRLSEAVLEREIKDALRWASEFLLVSSPVVPYYFLCPAVPG